VKWAWDILAGLGLVLLAVGLWLWSAALALVVVGALLMAAGLLGARAWSVDDLLHRAADPGPGGG
jgi:hypothetical protein